MNKEMLMTIVNNCIDLPDENEIVEFKVNNSDPENTGKIISALANSACLSDQSCAYLIFGISDEKKIVGTNFDPKTMKQGNEPLINWWNQRLNPKVEFEIYPLNYSQDVTLYIFRIQAATNRPVAFSNINYIRIGQQNRKLMDYPDKERRIWVNANKRSFEKMIAVEGVSDDSVLKLLDYPSYFKLTEQPLPQNKQEIITQLIKEDFVTRAPTGFNITNLGAVLFASSLSEFESIKRKQVRLIIYKGRDKIDALQEIQGDKGYSVGFSSLIKFLMDRLPTNEILKDSIREEIKMFPEIALREVIANALIHQDFDMHGTGPVIELFENRIEITNPGNTLVQIDKIISDPPISRNEKLASVMRRLGFCEERGCGIDRVINLSETYQLPPPEFETTNVFTKVTLFAYKPFVKMSSEEKIRATYQHCVLKYITKEPMTNSSLRKRFSIKESNYPIASRIIREVLDLGLIKLMDASNKSKKDSKYVPSWA
ncbi:MAG: putative DNA binding domain-containing protein [Candidatus Roizmanbacteria bacterium]|nr:putative DNA binding domain-containing protein [Candidatus Roizmanbacteria bacterium]